MVQVKSYTEFLNKFKKFDVFTKPLDDFQEKTLYGGFGITFILCQNSKFVYSIMFRFNIFSYVQCLRVLYLQV